MMVTAENNWLEMQIPPSVNLMAAAVIRLTFIVIIYNINHIASSLVKKIYILQVLNQNYF